MIIKLFGGIEVLIDDADFSIISSYKWGNHINRYARTQIGGRKNRKIIYMHRIIMNAPDGMVIDHINGNGFDNRRINLRVCTHAQNIRNHKLNTKNKSGYIGVSWDKQIEQWTAHITFNYKAISIGYFHDPIEAAKAYDKKAKELFGEFARTNF